MENKGNVLFKSKTDSLKNGIVFLLLGILMIVSSNFVYATIMLVIFGLIFLLIGLYLLFFKRSDSIIIYENVIVISLKKNLVIDKNDIKSISYKKIKPKGTTVSSYYAVLLLNNDSEQLINIAFNSMINTSYEKIIKSYLD